VSETLLTASHIALLSAFPLSASISLSHENIARVLKLQYYSEFDILTWTYWGAVGTLVGAWLGAAPIPLDWDRDWQVTTKFTARLIVEMAYYDCGGSVCGTRSWIGVECDSEWCFWVGKIEFTSQGRESHVVNVRPAVSISSIDSNHSPVISTIVLGHYLSQDLSSVKSLGGQP